MKILLVMPYYRFRNTFFENRMHPAFVISKSLKNLRKPWENNFFTTAVFLWTKKRSWMETATAHHTLEYDGVTKWNWPWIMAEIDQSQRIQTTKESNLAQSENKCRQACVKNVRSLKHYEEIGHLPNGAILSNASLTQTFLPSCQLENNC